MINDEMYTPSLHPPDSLIIEVESDRTVNYAYQQNGVPVIRTIHITNCTAEAIDDIQIYITSDPVFTREFSTHVSRIYPGTVVNLHSVDLSLSASFLSTRTERVRGFLLVEAYNQSGLLGTTRVDLDILAYNEWSGLSSLPEIIAAFITPNHPAIEKIHHDTGILLNSIAPGTTLSGYQTHTRSVVYTIASALYSVVQNASLVYSHAPASFEENGQQIRLPGRIMETGIGNCLDLTCLLAGCLEQAGLHPLVIIIEGHAFGGFWLDEESFADPVIDDLVVLRKRVELREICVFEPVALTLDPRVSFDESVRMAEKLLSDDARFRVVVDVHRTRIGIHRIHPLPLEIQGGSDPGNRSSGSSGQIPEHEQEIPHVHIPEPPILLQPVNSESEGTAGRFESWKRHLLDLSNRNSLLNFRESRQNLTILHPDPASLKDALADGRSYRIFPLPERDSNGVYPDDSVDYTADFLKREFHAHRLYTPIPVTSLPERLLQIYKTARTSITEDGASTLYLALGFLSWYEAPEAESPQMAPLILIPLEMERRSYQDGFTVRQGDEDPRINITLLHRLNVDFGVTIPGLDPLPLDGNSIDITSILLSFRHQIRDIDRWEVLDKAVIGHFSFSKFLMWRDLQAYGPSLLTHPLVACLNDPAKVFFSKNVSFPEPGTLDAICHPSELYLPLSADSSQQAAVRAAGLGSSFVLYGPPGTGKSQTITNIIAHCLARGKTVLFVSEKKVALDVVFDRLKSSGLGQFCLELHSNKSNKREVIRQFSHLSGSVDTGSRERWNQQSERLLSVRDHLNSYVKALHTRQHTGESYFDGISRLAGLRHSPVISLPFPDWDQVDADMLARYRDLVRRIRLAGDQCGHPSCHPWMTVQGRDWSIQWKNSVLILIESLIQQISELLELVRSLSLITGIDGEDLSLSSLETLEHVLSVLDHAGFIPSPLLTNPNPDEKITKIRAIIASGRRRDALGSWFSLRYQKKILTMDLKKLQQDIINVQSAGFLWRWSLLRNLRGTLDPLLVSGYYPDISEALEDISRIIQYKRRIISLQRVKKGAEEIFGHLWRSGYPDWDVLEDILNRTESVLGLVHDISQEDAPFALLLRTQWASILSSSATSPERADYEMLSRRYHALFSQINAGRDELVTLLRADEPGSFGSPDDPGYLSALLSRLQTWAAHINDLHSWCYWCETREKAVDMGLLELIRYYEENPESTIPLRELFDRSFYQQWTDYLRDRLDPLRTFVQADFEDSIAYFRRLDDICMQVCRDEVHSLLSSRLPSGDSPQERAEFAVLSHQMQLQRRHMPIRMLLQKIQTILPRVKPCMLMSPISVAQYLEPTFGRFDLVIFDEASQIPVWDAIGVIARGDQAIIVGDPKQLPPTHGFQRDSEEDDLDMAELESVLDDSIAAGVPPLHLTWHYRSRHESLIAFSNYHFYQNSLLTFPSPHQVSAVSLRPIGGTFDRGRTRTNRREAEAVTMEIVRRLRDPVLCHDSIGVVTFNAAQQDLIISLLEQARRDVPEIDLFFSDERHDAVFVKNLENVQGDERDLILFSVGFGPDLQGKVSMNFGPLNRDGGERRLNVAITRARKEVVVFSSILADQIDLSQTRSHGVRLLKNFLSFAQLGPSVIAEACAAGMPVEQAPLEEEIAKRLLELGREVHLHIGCGGYRIDIGVLDLDEPGRYLLGIQCDGSGFREPRTARDRFRLQDEVLRGLGWDLHRVWSSDWWDNPAREVERIEAAIMEAMMKRLQERSRSPDPPDEDVDDGLFIMGDSGDMETDEGPDPATKGEDELQPYTRYSNPVLYGSKEFFYRDDANYEILSVLSAIVQAEAPISKEVAMKKVIHHWGIRRLGPAITERIESFFEKAGIQVREEAYGVFLWDQDQDPASYQIFRVKQVFDPEPRRIDEIAPQEIGNAVRYLERQNPGISEQDLVRGVVRVFGMSRTGPAGERVIQGVIAGIERDILTNRGPYHDIELTLNHERPYSSSERDRYPDTNM